MNSGLANEVGGIVGICLDITNINQLCTSISSFLQMTRYKSRCWFCAHKDVAKGFFAGKPQDPCSLTCHPDSLSK